MKQIEGIRRARSAREIRDLDHAREIKTSLEEAPIVVKAKVGGTGSLFGSVTEKDLIAAIKSSIGIDIDRHRLKAPVMKKLGNYTAKVTLHAQVAANIQVQMARFIFIPKQNLGFEREFTQKIQVIPSKTLLTHIKVHKL
eukprot:gene1153-1168_t